MKTRKYLDIDGGFSRESAPLSGASSASSATYFGVSLEEQTTTHLLTFIEIYVALQPAKLTFVEIYVALQPVTLTFVEICIAPTNSLPEDMPQSLGTTEKRRKKRSETKNIGSERQSLKKKC